MARSKRKTKPLEVIRINDNSNIVTWSSKTNQLKVPLHLQLTADCSDLIADILIRNAKEQLAKQGFKQ